VIWSSVRLPSILDRDEIRESECRGITANRCWP